MAIQPSLPPDEIHTLKILLITAKGADCGERTIPLVAFQRDRLFAGVAIFTQCHLSADMGCYIGSKCTFFGVPV